MAASLALSVLASSVLAPSTSMAAEPTQEELDRAQAHFSKGLDRFSEGKLDASLVEFERAYQLSQNYKVLFNIALVYRDMRDYVGAVDTFDRYFKEGGSDIDEFRRAEVTAEHNKAKANVAELTINTDREGAEISIDDVVIGKTPLEGPVRVNSGRRKVVVIHESSSYPVTRFVKIAGGEQAKLDIEVRAAPPQAVQPAAQPVVVTQPSAAPQEREPLFTKWSWIGLGSAAALAAGATVTGIVALNASSELKQSNYAHGSSTDELDSTRSRSQAFALTTDILIVSAAITAGATLFFTLNRDPKLKTQTASPQLGVRFAGTGGGLVGTF